MGPERHREVHAHLVDHDSRNEAGTLHLALATGLPDAQVAAERDRSAMRAPGAQAAVEKIAASGVTIAHLGSIAMCPRPDLVPALSAR